MSDGVLCAARGTAETAVVRALDAAGLPLARRCADLAELLAAGAAGLGGVAVVSAELVGLDREAVHHLHGSGVWVIGLADESAGWTADRVGRLGVDTVLPAGRPEDAVVRAVQDVLARARRGDVPGGGAPAPAVELEPPVPAGAARPTPRGRLVAVWGPAGAPGRTTVALALADELAAGPGGALLVDADTYGGAVAPLLGLLDEAPGLAAACRAAATGRLDVPTLAGLAPQVGALRVLTGIARPERWPELPPASLEVVWALARALVPWTVVDCGFCLEQDELLSYDTRAPSRNGATLAALAEADVVVVVGTGDPIGLQRLVRGLGDLTDAGVLAERRVVVNRLRPSASGPRPAEAVREALRRYAGVEDVTVLPDDGPAVDGAVLSARTLAEHAPASPLRRALAGLAGSLAPVGAALTAD